MSKPVFHNKKSAGHHNRQDAISPQHEEIINFINECIGVHQIAHLFIDNFFLAWNQVYSEMCQEPNGCPSSGSKRF